MREEEKTSLAREETHTENPQKTIISRLMLSIRALKLAFIYMERYFCDFTNDDFYMHVNESIKWHISVKFQLELIDLKEKN